MKSLPLILALSVSRLMAEDLIVADFEGKTYGNWLVAEEAFSKGPSHQKKKIKGVQGEGFVSSGSGDHSETGHLVSPSFKVERDHLQFRIGGGSQREKLEVQLLVKDKIVRRTTAAKNSENLQVGSWDLEEFTGKQAQVRIIDQAKGDWGYILVDHIFQTDKKPPAGAIGSYHLEPLLVEKAKKPAPKNKPAPTAKMKLAPEKKSAPAKPVPTAKVTPMPQKKITPPAQKKPLPSKIKKNQRLNIKFTPHKKDLTTIEFHHAILRYDLSKHSLECLLQGNEWTALDLPIKPHNGKIALQLEVTKDSVQIASVPNTVTGSFSSYLKQDLPTLKVTGAEIHHLTVNPLAPAKAKNRKTLTPKVQEASEKEKTSFETTQLEKTLPDQNTSTLSLGGPADIKIRSWE